MSFHSVAKHALTVYYDGRADLVGKVLDGIAHELAEEQREAWRKRYTEVTASMGTDRAMAWAQGYEAAADMIDPEVG
ncbi:hypothetical protein [Streptomyces niveus]|uniref:hypothetical protein n=1 Tax=Streptomyces niveus TaxID=193462 RepID=UPI0038687F59